MEKYLKKKKKKKKSKSKTIFSLSLTIPLKTYPEKKRNIRIVIISLLYKYPPDIRLTINLET